MLPLVESLKILQGARTDQVVIATMASAREWMNLGEHPLDFIYAPSSMGQAPSVGLGIALSQPSRQVIVCNGDGCTLMNLGVLATITAAAPPNFVLIVFDNGVYEVTGMQPTAGSSAGRQSSAPVDFCRVARGCGFKEVFEFDELSAWSERVTEVLRARGPTFVLLRVEAIPGALVPKSPAPAPLRARALRDALCVC